MSPGGASNAGELSIFSSNDSLAAMVGYDSKHKIIGEVILAKFKRNLD